MAEPERRPLLQNGSAFDPDIPPYQASTSRKAIGAVVAVLFAAALAISLVFRWDGVGFGGEKDPMDVVITTLSRTGVVDGHVDLPWLIRRIYRNNATTVDLRHKFPGHVDIPRLKEGKASGFFWSLYVPCPGSGADFLQPTNVVRDTLEQIDVSRNLIEKFDEFRFVTTADEFANALDSRIASLLGVEGAHQLGNSLGVLRMYHALGVRYMTLTHMCHNAFADSGGYLDPLAPKHYGLSDLGRTLIKEMNRLGVIVDLSHTSDATARQAFEVSEAPVIWSHSSARGVWNVSRNVPDDILKLIGRSTGKDAVVMVNFSPAFVAADGNATVEAVADHVDHIANLAGKQHVGIGSDYDGIDSTPKGLEDISKYPNLFSVLYGRGWKTQELEGLAGGNIFRVYRGVEATSKAIQARGVSPQMDIYSARKDL